MSVAIIDYGMGNLKNVQKACEFLGVEAVITEDPKTIKEASHVILPGVGAFEMAIATLREKGLEKVIHEVAESGKPFLGICLGMQLLFEKSYENGEFEGLGLIEGEIVPIKTDLKVPHMGWNTLCIKKESSLLEGIPQQSYVYFVHSYHAKTTEEVTIAETTYGYNFSVAVQKDNVMGLQFHPEKSSEIGLRMLTNFLKLSE